MYGSESSLKFPRVVGSALSPSLESNSHKILSESGVERSKFSGNGSLNSQMQMTPSSMVTSNFQRSPQFPSQFPGDAPMPYQTISDQSLTSPGSMGIRGSFPSSGEGEGSIASTHIAGSTRSQSLSSMRSSRHTSFPEPRSLDNYEEKSLQELRQIAQYQYGLEFPPSIRIGDAIEELRIRDTLANTQIQEQMLEQREVERIENRMDEQREQMLEQQITSLETLPLEIIENILMRLDVDTIERHCRTDESVRLVCEDRFFWIEKLNYDFPGENMSQFVDPNDMNGIGFYTRFRDARLLSLGDIESGDVFLWKLSKGYVDTQRNRDIMRINAAVVNGNAYEVQHLMDGYGPDIDAVNAAAWYGHIRVLEILSDSGILPDSVGADMAIAAGNPDTLQWLADRGIFPSATGLDIARLTNNGRIIDWLRSHGLDVK